jgi:hypothetical protein
VSCGRPRGWAEIGPRRSCSVQGTGRSANRLTKRTQICLKLQSTHDLQNERSQAFRRLTRPHEKWCMASLHYCSRVGPVCRRNPIQGPKRQSNCFDKTSLMTRGDTPTHENRSPTGSPPSLSERSRVAHSRTQANARCLFSEQPNFALELRPNHLTKRTQFRPQTTIES